MKLRRIIFLSLSVLICYGVSYALFRKAHTEKWAKDKKEYVIFPKQRVGLYYFYRPAALVDGTLTGMRFHIGPHQE